MKKIVIFILFVLCFSCDIYSQKQAEYCSGKGYNGYIFDTSYLVLKSIANQVQKIELNCNDVALAEQILDKNLKALNEKKINQSQGCPNIKRKLCKYYRQYFGFQNASGERIIWINLFWDKSLIKQGQSELIMVNDGCSYYWNVEVNLTKGTLNNLYINGKG